MTLREELEELYEFKHLVEMRVFQKFIMEPVKKEIESLKNAYDCKTLAELQNLKGKEKGLRFIHELVKENENNIKNKKFEIDNSEN